MDSDATGTLDVALAAAVVTRAPLTRIERRRSTRRSGVAFLPWVVGLVTLALRLLTEQPRWRRSPVVEALAERARSLVGDADVAATLTPAGGLGFPDPAVASAVADLVTGAP